MTLCALIAAAAILTGAPSPHVLHVLHAREWRMAHERQILDELVRLVSLPNIASNQADIARNAALLTTMFEQRGFAVVRIATPGSPVPLARRDTRNAAGSLTFYMHYDGQPTEARDWTMGQPFAPAAFKDQTPVDLAASAGPVDPDVRIYGRAVADDKGPIVGFLAAMDGLIANGVTLPWNVRVVLDGEEEAGSPNFDAAMQAHAGAVHGDLAVIVDSPRHSSGLPTVFYGSRGLVGATVTVYGATGDLHSGNYGNFVPDPAMQLVTLLASMKDRDSRVTIRDFYEGVVPLTPTERRAIDEIPRVDQQLLERFGVMRQQHPDSRIELQHNLPTLTIVGLQSGTMGPGARNAISATATARVEMRLVNGLDAERQIERLTAHVREQATCQGLVQLPTIGGTLRFSTFSDTLKLPTIGLAVVNFDNNQHAADENLRVGHLWEAIEIFAALLTMQP